MQNNIVHNYMQLLGMMSLAAIYVIQKDYIITKRL